MPGVYRTNVGFAGGERKNPSYWSLGDYTETVRVEFNHQEISYRELLDVFWAAHDPGYNTGNRQYRNVVFYQNEEQRQQAEQSREIVAARIKQPVKTDIEPLGEYYPAENYHQKYYLRQSGKLASELKKLFASEADFIASTAVARVNGYLGCNGSAEQLQREIGFLGLSPTAQELLIEHLSTSCGGFKGVTCPAPQ